MESQTVERVAMVIAVVVSSEGIVWFGSICVSEVVGVKVVDKM